MQLLSNERRFILAVVAGELVISNRKKADIEAQLQRDGYDCMPANKKVPAGHTWPASSIGPEQRLLTVDSDCRKANSVVKLQMCA